MGPGGYMGMTVAGGKCNKNAEKREDQVSSECL